MNSGRMASRKHTALAAMTCPRGPSWIPGNTVVALVVFAEAVSHDLVRFAGKVAVMAVSEVAAVRQVQTEDCVAGLQHGSIGSLIRVGTRVRLHVGILGPEDFLGALSREVFDS